MRKTFDGFGTPFREKSELVAIVTADKRFYIGEKNDIFYQKDDRAVWVGDIQGANKGCTYRIASASTTQSLKPGTVDFAREGYLALKRLLTVQQ